MVDLKEKLASYSIDLLNNKRVIGIGTGKTVRALIERIYQNKDKFIDKLFITSSIDSEIRLRDHGFNVISIYTGTRPEIYIDSFDHIFYLDQIDKSVMIKGGGGALFREKILATYSNYRVYIGESSKVVTNETIIRVPIEVLPFAQGYVMDYLKKKEISIKPRESDSKIGTIFSDNGNMILDIYINSDRNLCELDLELKRVTGVLETGIFCNNLIDKVIIANNEDEVKVVTREENT
ncbi:ribose 5-phosphate isomerase A [Sulfuracidifex tepidarius]|uniref:Ribose 5-phosphate isomerase A n=1 Tax=Sulfuracidifex tepidarius TaxID=1294262 RepID=A0A510DWA0_9CREN|nr:ribose 5-phosphate isomerase A [Sulfuracidifex tepidarius]BBG24465.1 Ribose-5-phosphate isomerase A [Sulfuracidifex tepidarius]BBG27223.1 Ribose-5-phosphate isomerase A [Sulfuracidifex tepidarius]